MKIVMEGPMETEGRGLCNVVTVPIITIRDWLRLRRAILPSDIDVAVQWYQDSEVLRFSEGSTKRYDRCMVGRMYHDLDRLGELYVIEVWSDVRWQAIGDATLTKESLPIVIGDPQWRSKGIGRLVLNALIQRARQLGWTFLEVKGVYADNERARRLFEGAGFRSTGETVDPDGKRRIRYRRIL